MSYVPLAPRKPTTHNKPGPLRKSMVKDPVSAKDYLENNLIFCCEQCTFFEPKTVTCNIGYNCAPHLRAQQEKTYLLTGKLIFCRFLEID